jgi:hypothetical protein
MKHPWSVGGGEIEENPVAGQSVNKIWAWAEAVKHFSVPESDVKSSKASDEWKALYEWKLRSSSDLPAGSLMDFYIVCQNLLCASCAIKIKMLIVMSLRNIRDRRVNPLK